MTSCAARQDLQLEAASAAGRAAAAGTIVDIGRLPDECYEKIPPTPKTIGTNVVVLLKREKDQLYKANDSKLRCAKVHDEKRENLLRAAADEHELHL